MQLYCLSDFPPDSREKPDHNRRFALSTEKRATWTSDGSVLSPSEINSSNWPWAISCPTRSSLLRKVDQPWFLDYVEYRLKASFSF